MYKIINGRQKLFCIPQKHKSKIHRRNETEISIFEDNLGFDIEFN